MNLFSYGRRGATVAGMFSLAAGSVLLLCGAGSAPIENLLPQGAMQGDLNAGGHSVTNAATVSATNFAGNAANLTNFPTLNQNTTGTAASITGTTSVAHGGTGATSLTAGDILVGNGTSAVGYIVPGTGVATALAQSLTGTGSLVAAASPTINQPYFTPGATVTGAGTVSQSGTTVTGVGTSFTTCGLVVGSNFLPNTGTPYELRVVAINSDTSLTVNQSQSYSGLTWYFQNPVFSTISNTGSISGIDSRRGYSFNIANPSSSTGEMALWGGKTGQNWLWVVDPSSGYLELQDLTGAASPLIIQTGCPAGALTLTPGELSVGVNALGVQNLNCNYLNCAISAGAPGMTLGTTAHSYAPGTVLTVQNDDTADSGVISFGSCSNWIPGDNSATAKFANVLSAFTYGSSNMSSATMTIQRLTGTVRNSGSGSLGAMYGLDTHLGNQSHSISGGTMTLTGLTQIQINSPLADASDTIGTSTGLYIGPQAVTGVTTGQGIIQQGSSDINSFDGQTIFTNTGNAIKVLTANGDQIIGGNFFQDVNTSGNINWFLGMRAFGATYTGDWYMTYYSNAAGGSVPFKFGANGDFSALLGNLIVGTAGKTVSLKGGSNGASGTVTLASGTGTITSSAITSSSVLFFSLKTSSGTPGVYPPLASVTNGSATVSGLSTDNSTYNWGMILANQ